MILPCSDGKTNYKYSTDGSSFGNSLAFEFNSKESLSNNDAIKTNFASPHQKSGAVN